MGEGRTCGDHGGTSKDGTPCGRPAGWGTAYEGGPCVNHRADLNGPRAPLNGSDGQQPPPGLSAEAEALWRQVLDTWHVGPDGLRLLQAACYQWDLYRDASKVLREEGPTVRNPDSGAVHKHPAASVAKDALLGFRMALKDMGLEPINWEK